ncbi:hypothetical protein [Algoriphagus sp.]|uniref:hypothetical protein n=1 Tax=Algoriphagus sp. TaxID=1872435 RepID=UPI00391C1A23
MKRLTPNFDEVPESSERKEADHLVNLINAYENIHFSIPENEVKTTLLKINLELK